MVVAGGRGWCGSDLMALRPLKRESRQQVRKQGDDGSRQEVGGFNGLITGKAEKKYSKCLFVSINNRGGGIMSTPIRQIS